jgi:hypothetical protein
MGTYPWDVSTNMICDARHNENNDPRSRKSKEASNLALRRDGSDCLAASPSSERCICHSNMIGKWREGEVLGKG